MKPTGGIFTFRGTVLCALIAAGIALYGRTLSYPFVFDCWTYIQNNPLITDLGYFKQLSDPAALVRLDRQLGLPPNVMTDFLLRPLCYLTLTVNYLVHGLDPAGFRAVNVALHILNAMLVFLVLEQFLERSPTRGTSGGDIRRRLPAFAAALFLLHPLQTESVTYIIQRSTVLASSCALLVLWLYLRSADVGLPRGKSRLFGLGALIALLLGMFVKESMCTVPMALLLLELTCLGHNLRTAVRRTGPYLLLMPVVPLLVFFVEKLQRGGDLVAPPGVMNFINFSGYPPSHYAITQLSVIATYLRLLLLPYGQNIDPDQPLYTSLFQGPPLVSLMLLAAVVLLALLAFRRWRGDVRGTLILFGTGWFFLGLSVSSGMVPLPDLMAESRVYGASVGFAIVLAALLDLLAGRCRTAPVRHGIIAIAVMIVAAYGTVAWARNEVWRSASTLWQDSVSKSPGKDRPWHNLGMAFMDENRTDEAIACFNKALMMNPAYVRSHEALVVAYTRAGRMAEAQVAAIAGLSIAPNNAVLYNNLGVVFAETGLPDTAQQMFEIALQLKPGYESARINLERLRGGR